MLQAANSIGGYGPAHSKKGLVQQWQRLLTNQAVSHVQLATASSLRRWSQAPLPDKGCLKGALARCKIPAASVAMGQQIYEEYSGCDTAAAQPGACGALVSRCPSAPPCQKLMPLPVQAGLEQALVHRH